MRRGITHGGSRHRSGTGTQFASVLLVVAALLVGPVTFAESGEPPSTSIRVTALQPPTGFTALDSGASSGWVDFAPVAAGDTVMVAADWGGGVDVDVEVRASDGRGWTSWFPFIFEPEHGPDLEDLAPGQTPSTDADPIWIGDADTIQVRARGNVGSIDLVRMESSGGAGLQWTPPVMAGGAAAQAATERPGIVSRASWGADETIRRYTPREWNRANFAIVHHTAGRNDYGRDEVDDILRSVYAYHVLRRGWDDIAYNFLVDRFGTVWEGRAGGTTRPVIGGHASGFNGGSIGISAIGNFQSTEPTVEMLDALERVLAWKLDVHHLDPHGESEEIAGGGSSNRFSQGERVTVPNIIGHRHTNSTSCPGDKLYEHVRGLNGDVSLADRVDGVGHPKAYGGPPQDREQPLHGIRPSWDVDFTQPVIWQLSIVAEDGMLVRRGTGQSDGKLELRWDMRGSNGELVAPGRYVAQLDAESVDGQAIMPVQTIFEVTDAADRAAGTSRTKTATELSSLAFTQNERVVIASSEVFPDALVAGPLAGSLAAPILLVPSWGVPEEVTEEIQRLHASKAYIVGGLSRIPKAVEDQLRAAGITSVTRLSGTDRYQTSAAVARFLINRDHPTEALLALGEHPDPSRAFPDALSAGGFGASQISPVLLVAKDVLPGAIDSVLGQRPWKDGLVVFGGLGAISAATADEAARAAGRYSAADKSNPEPAAVLRFAGRDRYETSSLAADELLVRWAADLERKGPSPYAEPTGMEVLLASAKNWPDALGASAAAAQRGAVFLLVAPDLMQNSEATRAWLEAHADELAHAVISGGPGAVSPEVQASIGAIVASRGWSQQPPEAWPGEQRTDFPFDLPSFPPDEPEPEPEPEPTPSPTGTPSSEPSPSPTGSPGPSPSPTASPTPESSDPAPEPADGEPSEDAGAKGGEL